MQAHLNETHYGQLFSYLFRDYVLDVRPVHYANRVTKIMVNPLLYSIVHVVNHAVNNRLIPVTNAVHVFQNSEHESLRVSRWLQLVGVIRSFHRHIKYKYINSPQTLNLRPLAWYTNDRYIGIKNM